MVLQVKSTFPAQVVEEVVKSALRDQANLARLRFEQFQNECRAFEEKFGMSSEDFLHKFESGELGDDEVWFDWFAAVRGRDRWSVKMQVLDQVCA